MGREISAKITTGIDSQRPVLSLIGGAGIEHDARAIYLKEGLFGLGEKYVDGGLYSEKIDDLVYRLISNKALRPPKFTAPILKYLLAERFKNLQRGNGIFEIAHRHYDLGNDLFRAMLDSSMSYTCAYWKGANCLEEAQKNKLEIICRKLKLAPGMRVLDIGCGWGNFARYAAEHYGVEVVGLTVSNEQARLARERCSGLPVTILVQDYKVPVGVFDRVVSIEMIEAVGRKNLPAFYEVVGNALKPGGLFALQAISAESFTRRSAPALDGFVVWLLKYIFPNGYLPNLRELIEPARSELVMEDVHNISADYDRTLAAWRSNFNNSWGALERTYGERFKRIWNFYLSGCMAFFRARMGQVYQVVYSKGGVPGGYDSIR